MRLSDNLIMPRKPEKIKEAIFQQTDF